MGMTMTQKILAAHAGLDTVVAGQLIEADLDLVLGNDITSPVAIHEIEKMKVDGVFHKDKIALVMDHFVSNLQNIANVFVSLPANMRLAIILMLERWALSMHFFRKKDSLWQEM